MYAGNSKVTGKDGGKESMLKTTKKSSANQDSAEVDKASLQQSPRKSGDSLGRNGAKGKVKEFVKIFNQEASSKPLTNSEPRSQSSRWKNTGPFRAEKGANVCATETEEQMHVDNTNRNKMVPDASIMVLYSELFGLIQSDMGITHNSIFSCCLSSGLLMWKFIFIFEIFSGR